MHRSGTSALTGLLHQFGLHAGNHLFPANEFNERGYFECADIVTAHDVLLGSLGRSWDDVRPLPEGWQNTSAGLVAKSTLLSIFRTEFGDAEICVLKDPRLCRLLPLWRQIFAELEVEPLFIIISRQPAEVAASLARRDGMTGNQAAMLYLAYLLDAELCTRSDKRLISEFSSLLNDWTSLLPRMIAAFGFEFPLPSAERGATAGAFLEPELKHFNAGPTEATDGPAGLAGRLYGLLTAVQDASSASQFDALRSDFDACLQMLEPWLSQATRVESLERELFKPDSLAEAVVSKGSVCTLYWNTGEYLSFDEARTIKVSPHFGGNAQTLRFYFSSLKAVLTGLRLDITSVPAFCILHHLRLENASGATVWAWNGRGPIFSMPSVDMHLLPENTVENGLPIFSTGFDPHAYLNLPSELLAQVTVGWALVVEATFQLPHVGLSSVFRAYEHAEVRLCGMEQRQCEFEQALAQASLKESAQSDEIAALRHQHKQCRDEILRAEAQLGLLKDLMLGDGALENW